MLVMRHLLAITGIISAVARSQIIVLALSTGITAGRMAAKQGDGDVCQR